MTAVVYPSLDGLLAAATPVETEPFNVKGAMIAYLNGYPSDEDDLARYVNTLRVDTENARRWVDRLQGECAAKDEAMREALRWLDMAATYATSEDVAAAIDDAAAALRGGAE